MQLISVIFALKVNYTPVELVTWKIRYFCRLLLTEATMLHKKKLNQVNPKQIEKQALIH